MLGSEYTWLTLALLTIIGLIVWKGLKPILAALDARGERIRSDLDEAHSLREEAQRLLAESKRKQRDSVEEAEAILSHAKAEAERLRKTTEAQLSEALARREQQAMDKIAQAEAEALAQVRNQAVNIAVAAAGKLIGETLDEAQLDKITADSIKDVANRLN